MKHMETAELNDFCLEIIDRSGNNRNFCQCNPAEIDIYCFLLVQRYGDLQLHFDIRKDSGKESRKFLGMTKMTTIDFIGAVLTDGRRFMRVEDLGADICGQLFDTEYEKHSDESPECKSIFLLNPQIKPKHRLGMYPSDEKDEDEYQGIHKLPQ